MSQGNQRSQGNHPSQGNLGAGRDPLTRFNPLERHKDFIRSIRGQLILLGGAYLGAAVLATAAILLRGAFFQPHSREKFTPLAGAQRELAENYAKDTEARPPRLESWSEAEFHALYGAALERTIPDEAGRIRSLLARDQAARLFERLRGTLVVGNSPQRLAALDWLAAAPEVAPNRTELLKSLALARRRAERKGEREIVERCLEIISQVSSQQVKS